MLKKLVILPIIILIFVIGATAQSQRQSISRSDNSKPIQKHGENKQQTTESYQRGTEDSPFVVKTINPPKTQAEINQERADREEKAASNRHLVRFTGGLVVVGALQAVILLIQIFLLCGTLRATKKAADAAKDSAEVAKDTLKSTQRAFVFLKEIKFEEIRGKGYTSMPSNDQTTWMFFPCWVNSGGTPTRNLTINIGCKITSQDLPDDFDYSFSNQENVVGYNYAAPTKDIKLMIGPKSEILSTPLVVGMLERSASMIIKSTNNIFIWGQAEYNDIFDATPKHITRFCVKLFFANQIGQVGRQRPLMSIAYYGKYNCADEECNDQS